MQLLDKVYTEEEGGNLILRAIGGEGEGGQGVKEEIQTLTSCIVRFFRGGGERG